MYKKNCVIIICRLKWDFLSTQEQVERTFWDHKPLASMALEGGRGEGLSLIKQRGLETQGLLWPHVSC